MYLTKTLLCLHSRVEYRELSLIMLRYCTRAEIIIVSKVKRLRLNAKEKGIQPAGKFLVSKSASAWVVELFQVISYFKFPRLIWRTCQDMEDLPRILQPPATLPIEFRANFISENNVESHILEAAVFNSWSQFSFRFPCIHHVCHGWWTKGCFSTLWRCMSYPTVRFP